MLQLMLEQAHCQSGIEDFKLVSDNPLQFINLGNGKSGGVELHLAMRKHLSFL
jgi:hypothetical protein